METITLGGTGHRPERLLISYSKEDFNKLVKFLTKQITSFEKYLLIQNKRLTKIISGGAIGFDQALAQAALNLNIDLTFALPNKNFHKKWPSRSQKYFEELLNKANSVFVFSPEEKLSYSFYFGRDKYIVDNSDYMFTIYDGVPKGGTHITLEYAETNSKQIYNLYTKWEKYVNES